MSFEQLSNIKDIIKQELSICKVLLEEESFEQLNVFGNRIMENCLFSDDYRLFTFGLFIKEIALLNRNIISSKEPKAVQTVKTISSDFISKLEEALKESDFNEEKTWNEFHILNVRINELLKNKLEKKYYQENIEFTNLVSINLIKYLKDQQDTLYLKYNHFFGGILNILDRMFRVHSGSIEFTLRSCFIKTIDRFYEYLLTEHYKEHTLDKERMSLEIEPYIEFLTTECIKEEIDITLYDKELWEIVKNWRLYYIKYMNIMPPFVEPQKKIIKLPKETRKIIENSLKESIEKKIK
ncbi:MAG: hypothetical protein ACTSRI_20890 [Promethearchaeota archaeon]